MAIKIYKRNTAGRRNMSVVKSDMITDQKPEKSLLARRNSRGAGRSGGKISVRHQGGGHKQRYRMVDFLQNKFGIQGIVVSIEKDPVRSAFIALINYIDGEWNTYKTFEDAWKRPVFKYSTYEAPLPKVDNIIPASKLPENIEEIPDDILNWAIRCSVTNKPFRILKQELEFYRKHNLPIPKKHPDQRHLDRLALRNQR